MLELDFKRFRMITNGGEGYRPDEGKRHCPVCHRRLSRASWSKGKDIVQCLNWDCRNYMQIEHYVDLNYHNRKRSKLSLKRIGKVE